MNLKALTSKELETVFGAIDGIYTAYDIFEAAHVLTDDDDMNIDELATAIVEEMTSRAMGDAGYEVNQMVGRGELDRYIRPDGEIGYGPAGCYGEGAL